MTEPTSAQNAPRHAARPSSRRQRAGQIGCGVAVIAWLGLMGFGLTMCAIKTMGPTVKAPILALYREDGVVYAETAACERDAVRSFYVDIDGGVTARWSIFRRPDAAAPRLFRLFEVPSGWRLDASGYLRSRPVLRPGVSHLVWLRTDLDDQAAFAFDPAQLASTSHDRVLLASGKTDQNADPLAAPVSRDEFDRKVGRYCAKNHPS